MKVKNWLPIVAELTAGKTVPQVACLPKFIKLLSTYEVALKIEEEKIILIMLAYSS